MCVIYQVYKSTKAYCHRKSHISRKPQNFMDAKINDSTVFGAVRAPGSLVI